MRNLLFFSIGFFTFIHSQAFGDTRSEYVEPDANLAPVLPTNKKEFCEAAKDPHFFINKIRYSAESRVSFPNPKRYEFGIEVGYLCWWHARFQINSAYLAFTRDLKVGEAPAKDEEINGWIYDLVNHKRVVELRGYSSFSEFTNQHKDKIIEEMKRVRSREFDFGIYRLVSFVGGIRFSGGRVVRDLKKAKDLLDRGAGVPFFIGFMEKALVDHGLAITDVKPGNEDEDWTIELIESANPKKTLINGLNPRNGLMKTKKFGAIKPIMYFEGEMKDRFQAIINYCEGGDVPLNSENYFEDYLKRIQASR
jgi:hypothetical protein